MSPEGLFTPLIDYLLEVISSFERLSLSTSICLSKTPKAPVCYNRSWKWENNWNLTFIVWRLPQTWLTSATGSWKGWAQYCTTLRLQTWSVKKIKCHNIFRFRKTGWWWRDWKETTESSVGGSRTIRCTGCSSATAPPWICISFLRKGSAKSFLMNCQMRVLKRWGMCQHFLKRNLHCTPKSVGWRWTLSFSEFLFSSFCGQTTKQGLYDSVVSGYSPTSWSLN